MAKAIFQLEPFTCPSCIKKIETALAKTAGVTAATVLFNAGKVKAEFDSFVIQAEEIAIMIENLGYPVKSKRVS